MKTTPEYQLEFETGDKQLQKQPLVSSYLDFREYLRDFYHYKKEQTKHSLRPYSYSVFSAAADIRSPNYLKLIIEGKRNLSEGMIQRFAKALQLDKSVSAEFYALVMYGQATDPTERNRYLKELSELRVSQKIEAGEIDKNVWEQIPSWVSWVLYALVDLEGVQFDSDYLARLLRGNVSKDDICVALDRLIQSEVLACDEDGGRVKKGKNFFKSAQEVPVALVRKLQAELMYMGLESLFRDEPTEREFGSATLVMTEDEFEDLRFQLRKWRKQIQKENAVQRAEVKGDRVYQLNMQLYPLTNSVDC